MRTHTPTKIMALPFFDCLHSDERDDFICAQQDYWICICQLSNAILRWRLVQHTILNNNMTKQSGVENI